MPVHARLATLWTVGGEAALVGRLAELSTLERVLGQVHAGQARIAEVVGEPGIGKSRLLAELAASADRRGDLVVASRAAEFLQTVPFGIFAAALDDYLTSLELSRLEGLDPLSNPELATVIPAFVPLAGPTPPALHAERFKTHRAVRALLEALSRTRPLVVVLDDVHWVDPASLELLVHLLVRPPACPVLLALGYRPAQVAPRLRAALAEAVRDGAATRVELCPLSFAEVEAFVGDRASAPARDHLYRDSGGNPFYLEQLLRGAGLARSLQPLGLPRDSVPPPVAAALAAELASLPVAARTLLEGAAVVGDPFDDDLAAAAAELDEADALDRLDELLERDLVRPTVAPRRFRFRHPIVRRAVYESSRRGWRVGAHARVGAALADHGAPSVARAQHVERSARRGDLAAIDVLLDAAAASELRAPAMAARWYDGALHLLPEGPTLLPRRLELLARKATALGVAGQFEDSHAALCEVLDLLPERAEGRVGLVAFCAAIERLLGRMEDARRRLTQALGEVENEASSDGVALKIELAVDAFVSCDFSAMRAWAQDGLDAAEALGEPLLEACAAGVLALAEYNLVLPWAEHVERGRAVVDGLTDDRLAIRLDAASWVAYAEGSTEQFTDSYEHASRVIRVARATGRGQFINMTMIGQLYALMFSSRLAEAEVLAEAAIDSFGPAGEPALAEALCCRGFVRAARSDVDGALRDGEEALERHKARGRQPLLAATGGIFLASFLIDAGAPERAREVLMTTLGGPSLRYAERTGRVVALEILTRAELDLGNLAAAEGWARQATEANGAHELPISSGRARRAFARVLLAKGDASAAAELALLAAEEAATGGSPLESGRSRILAGGALAHAGHRERARLELERAETELRACGASGYGDEAAAELRRLGFRRREAQRRPGPGVDSLTERERLIAELVSEGKTNREIASACYLSVKTVERHVAHLFDKLGVASRAAVAGVVARHRSS